MKLGSVGIEQGAEACGNVGKIGPESRSGPATKAG
jgi:hypothetical protein